MEAHIVDGVVFANDLFILVGHRPALRALHDEPEERVDAVDGLFDGPGIGDGALDELDAVVTRRSEVEYAEIVDFAEVRCDEGTDVSGAAD